MKRQIIHSDAAPRALGPYSQAVRMGDLLFTAGQVPVDPATGALVEGGIEDQTRRVMDNLRAVLQAANCDFSDVAKTTIFVTDLVHFAALNEVYGTYFAGLEPPARSTVQVAALPLGALVEIEMLARVPR